MKRIVILFLCGLFIFYPCNIFIVYGFTDISDTSTQAAVDTLVSFNIINGYDDNTFKPNNYITRAEFAKIIITTTKNEQQLSNSTHFIDIPETHWAKTYINISKNLGIVNGITESIFAPEENITYEQAIKMIVVALGYDKEALQKGGYPDGYISVARDLGILAGLSYYPTEKATRGNIALIIRKSLDVPFYFIYNNGQSLVKEKSQATLFELHMETQVIEKKMNELPEYNENQESDNVVDAVG